MDKWRLLPLIETNASKQMAIDEAILTARAKNLVPNTLRFFTWKPRAVSLGYFQSVEQEINLDNLKKIKPKTELVRRITGGGAVLHDKELTYSIILSEEDVPKNIQESYKVICGAIIEGLKKFNKNLNPEFREINDILLNGKKVSGNAQTRRNTVILQHGTILLDVDVKTMFSILKVPDEKLKDKIIKSVEERVTSLKKELNGEEIEIKKLSESLVKGFEEVFNVSFVGENLTDEELKFTKEFEKKYSSKEWIFKR